MRRQVGRLRSRRRPTKPSVIFITSPRSNSLDPDNLTDAPGNRRPSRVSPEATSEQIENS